MALKAKAPEASIRSGSGMVLGELVIAMLLLGVVGGLVLATWLGAVRRDVPARISVGGRTLPVAPTYAAFPAAVRLHATLGRHLATARCVYVFGGRHAGLESAAPPSLRRPLALARLPELVLDAGLPGDAASFYAAYASQLGPERTSATADDFTVLALGPRNGVLAPLCLVQVTSETATVASPSGGAATFLVRNVRLWDAEGSGESYAFAEPAGRRSGFVGAVHTWFRFNPADALGEEGPALGCFPDPWLWSGSRGEPGEAGAFSRFGYLLSPNP